jgi:hypothetical protein
VGESQEIIVDQIEIGRDYRCQVRFDESFTTVSRRHAAIVKEGDKWKLIQLSDTNPTLLNGNKVAQEWYLQNGDEIQLAIGGPKLGFLIPAGKTMGSIGFTRRLDLFGKQALRPYRRAILLLSLFLLLAIGAGSYIIWGQKKVIAAHEKTIAETKDGITQLIATNDTLQIIVNETKDKLKEDSIRIAKIPRVVPKQDVYQLITAVKKDVYFVETRSFIKYENETHPIDVSYGTGFVLQDGYFVTARHCVETWLYPSSKEAFTANACVTTYPTDFQVYSEIRAYSDNKLQFTLKSSEFRINRNNDVSKQVDVDEDGRPIRMKFAYPITQDNGETLGSLEMLSHDWAYAKISPDIYQKSSLVADYESSVSLHAGEEIHMLGFPVGIGVADGNQLVEPIYNKMSVSRDGLDKEGCITVSQGSDHGNSGGPVFIQRNNKLVVVGIVSRGDYRTTQYDHIVPIKQIEN